VLFGIAFAKGITAIIGMPSEIKLWAVAAGPACWFLPAWVCFLASTQPAERHCWTRLRR